MAIHRSDFLTLAVALGMLAWGTDAAASVSEDSSGNNSKLICSPTKWYNILIFFVTNYAIHAATVRSLPGESGHASTAYKVCCLLVPYAGVRRGLNVFLRASSLSDNALHCATRANALCMVVRSKEWRPLPGDIVQGCDFTVKEAEAAESKTRTDSSPEDLEKGVTIESTTTVENQGRNVSWDVKAPYEYNGPSTWYAKMGDFMLRSYRFRSMPLEDQVVSREDIEVHGVCRLPLGYSLCFIPPHMDVIPRGSPTDKVLISSQFSAMQVLWSIAQTCVGSYTLYQARGSQLERYGYAAFGLTVIPYIIASMINLFASLVTRQYDYVFLVHSEIMDEAVARGGCVDGVVGTICPPSDHEETLGESGKLGTAAFEIKSSDDPEGGLICQRIDIPPPSPTNLETIFTITLPKPSTDTSPSSVKRWVVIWKRFTKHINNVFNKPPSKQHKKTRKTRKDTTAPEPTIRVPSHGPYRRLPPRLVEPIFYLVSILLLLASVAAPYIIIDVLTGWQIRQATDIQSTFTTHWLFLGQIFGLSIAEFERHTKPSAWIVVVFFALIFYSWAAIGGGVVVAQEMIEFGTCSSL
ncbi:hypothetical protein B7494_g2476 [Chlorociboria aeruginascens]|nr:hypothetical protein B7494_g2476 [Chlorociboria aeruginascens]